MRSYQKIHAIHKPEVAGILDGYIKGKVVWITDWE